MPRGQSTSRRRPCRPFALLLSYAVLLRHNHPPYEPRRLSSTACLVLFFVSQGEGSGTGRITSRPGAPGSTTTARICCIAVIPPKSNHRRLAQRRTHCYIGGCETHRLSREDLLCPK